MSAPMREGSRLDDLKLTEAAALSQPVIPTDRFVLRPLRPSDAGLIAHYTGDRRVAEGTRAIPHPLPPRSSESFVARALSPDRVEDVWAIDGSANNLAEVLGIVSLTRMEGDQSELGFWIGAGFWNTGFATEAVAAIVAANPHGARTLFAEAFQDNPGSARVLTNCGFAYLGDAESWSVARSARVPTWTYLRKMA
ncbi:GNAT family N-acetyltransferase [Paracoccus sp. 1_MG-2023]|uniref:GNAT family N-acetyltransferase n=2 Tax=unclassified Paracoccus (in: a-proteobacteria) TaxID=2688777 RepID=UPI0026E3BFB3|nr:GNAT family N-acetyltransferase [Paracoccus sp. 1_MG-2023]MDO6667561.1 GNAT family N-acetyltransferase [Paracoccus sp. 1_MG-2023]